MNEANVKNSFDLDSKIHIETLFLFYFEFRLLYFRFILTRGLFHTIIFFKFMIYFNYK